MNSKNDLNSIVARAKDKDLNTLVYTLYKYRIGKEDLPDSKVLHNIKIKGNSIYHNIDVYVEFRRMNNTERTLIKTFDGKIVTSKDVWEFDSFIKDLGFYPKGILYYNKNISEKAKKLAADKKIDAIYFDVFNEIKKNVENTLSGFLPDGKVIGDPFWAITKLDLESKMSSGLYYRTDSILLFTSKKAAEEYCSKNVNDSDYGVVGITQKHLSALIDLAERFNGFKYFNIFYSCNQRISDNGIRVYLDDIRKNYVRK